MIFLNISTDYVQLLSPEAEELIFRNDVETKLGPSLIQRFRKYGFATVLLINGPGGFTNLRVGVLCLNLLSTLIKLEGKPEEDKFKIYEISKLDLFTLAVQKSILPKTGAVYIGQKRTLWLYDFDNKSYKIVKKEDLPYSNDNIFFDKVYDTDYFTEDITSHEISFLRDGESNMPVMDYQKHKIMLDINKLPIHKVDIVKANYMVQPVIG